MATTTCTHTDCGTEFFLIEERGEIKHLCLIHGDEHMRAKGHQNDLAYVTA